MLWYTRSLYSAKTMIDTHRRTHRIILATALFLFLTGTGGVLTQETVLHDYFSATPDSDIEDILYYAAGVELVEAGISSTREAGHQFAYRLYTAYTVADESIVVRYELRDVDSDTHLADTVLHAAIDSNLDRRIASVIRQLHVRGGLTGSQTAQAYIHGLGTGPGASVHTENDIDQDFPDEHDETIAEASPEPEEKTPPEPQEPQPPPEGRIIPGPAVAIEGDPTDFEGPEVSVGSGGMLVVGDGSKYFRHGVFGRLAGGWVQAHRSLTLSYGGALSVYRVFTNDNIAGGSLVVTTFGPELRLGAPADGPGRIGLRVSTGAALVTVTSSAEALSKIAPYVDTAIEAGALLGNRFTVGLALGFTGVVEESLTFTGFTSAITTAVRL